LSKMLPHLLEDVIPNFAQLVKPGDIIVGGKNFGIGSSREQAPRLLKMAGITVVVAKNFARIFFRNSINLGLPAVEAKLIPDVTETGDILHVDLSAGVVVNETKGVAEKVRPYPPMLLEILEAGGVFGFLKKRGIL